MNYSTCIISYLYIYFFSAFGFENFDALEDTMSDYERRLSTFATIMTNPADDMSARLAEGLFHAPSQG